MIAGSRRRKMSTASRIACSKSINMDSSCIGRAMERYIIYWVDGLGREKDGCRVQSRILG